LKFKASQLGEYLAVFFKEKVDIDKMLKEIMDGKEQLTTRELYDTVSSLTTFKGTSTDLEKILNSAIEKEITERPALMKKDPKAIDFVFDKNGDFIKAIFKIDNKEYKDRFYIKYELLGEFYKNTDKYYAYATKFAANGKATPGVVVPTPGIADIKKEKQAKFEEDNEEEKVNIKNNFAAIFNKKTSNESDGADTGRKLLKRLKDEVVVDFASRRKANATTDKSSLASQKTIEVSKEEQAQFNKMIGTFLKEHKAITDKEVVSSSLQTMMKFMFEENGSAKFQKLKGDSNVKFMDILDFWKALEKDGINLKFETDYEK
jgi:hypothetical protein